ncbi:MAG: hypothetical protein ACREM3_16510 [Candidatus Rokuibacteriota bacterium]
MRTTSRRSQLALEWTDRVQWDDLSVAAHAELRRLLRELLRQGAADDDAVEGVSDE